MEIQSRWRRNSLLRMLVRISFSIWSSKSPDRLFQNFGPLAIPPLRYYQSYLATTSINMKKQRSSSSFLTIRLILVTSAIAKSWAKSMIESNNLVVFQIKSKVGHLETVVESWVGHWRMSPGMLFPSSLSISLKSTTDSTRELRSEGTQRDPNP